jgi:tetratricopeptide (TPR) repeat protein
MWTRRCSSWAARVVTLGSLLFVVAGALPASAAVSCDRDPKCAALAEQGKEALSRGELDAALSAYQAAHRLRPTPKLLYNIARVQHKAGRYGEAIESYQQYLRDGASEPQPQLGKAQQFLSEAQAQEEARLHPKPEPPSPPAVVEKPLPLTPPAPLVERRAVPRWRTGLGVTLFLAGGVAAGFGISALVVNGGCRPLPPSTLQPCVEQYDTRLIGASLLGAGAAVALGGVLFMAIPSGRKSPPKMAQASAGTERRL